MNADSCERRIIHAERLTTARQLLSRFSDLPRIGDLFKTLSDPGRLQILTALNDQEMCVCDLAALLEVSESAASHQMRVLRAMNLVKNRRDGQVLYYRLDDEHVMQLVEIARTHLLEKTDGEAHG